MKGFNAIHVLLFLGIFMTVGIKTAVVQAAADNKQIEEKVNALVSKMTLEEKIGQMAQGAMFGPLDDNIREAVKQGKFGSFLNAGDVNTKNEMQKIAIEQSRLGIPLIYGRDVIHGYRTALPIPLGQAASWDPALVQAGARVAAIEAASEGIKWTFAPMVDISRDPRWGRIAESCGEDPYLASVLGSAMVKGFQGDDLADSQSIAACGKHYVGYGLSEGGRDYNSTWIPERQLRDVYLPPFHAAVNAGLATLMSAFNAINDVPASGNEFTLRQILRNEWGFDGFVVSDWGSMTEMINHGFCADEKEVAYKSLKAGVDMEMVSTSYAAHLAGLVNEGKIDEKLIDESVRNILRVKFRAGLFDNPYTDASKPSVLLAKEHLQAAQKLATESIVLLQNKNNVLPLDKSAKVAVIGPLANSGLDQVGCWALDSKPEDSVTPLTAIREFVGEKNVFYAEGLEKSRTIDKKGFAAAIDAAKKADVVLLFLGEEEILSGEAKCRAFLNLPGAQEELVAEIAKTGKPMAAVILAGRPLTFQNVSGAVQSVLYAWHPGTMGGPALADVIYGVTAPSGKLPVTFPRTVGQVPLYYAHLNTGRPASEESGSIPMGTPLDPVGYTSKYLDVDFTPEYVFGYGLSYTTFEYSSLELSSAMMKLGDKITVSATVKNTGKVTGDEVVQLYVRDLFGSVSRPVKELKGFKRITLKPGESQKVSFDLSTNDLAFWDINMKLNAEPGDFHVWIGGSSKADLKGEFSIE